MKNKKLLVSIISLAIIVGIVGGSVALINNDSGSKSTGAHVHTYDTVGSIADCTRGGKITKTCSICGITKVITSNPTGHSFITMPAQKATCVLDGHSEYKECSVCKSVKNKTVYGAKGHSFHGGVCTECGCGESVTELSGTWRFNDELTAYNGNKNVSLYFMSNGYFFEEIDWVDEFIIAVMVSDNINAPIRYIYDYSEKEINDLYAEIHVEGVQNVPTSFYDWLMENAIQI